MQTKSDVREHGEYNLEISNLFIACESFPMEIPYENSAYLEKKCADVLRYDDILESDVAEVDRESCEYILENIEQDEDGRLVVPLLWEPNSSHLSQNLNLSKKLLFSIKNKIEKVPNGLKMVDDVLKEQVDMKVIEPISNLEEFMNDNPDSAL